MNTAEIAMKEAIAGPPPDGYGDVIHPTGRKRPEWLEPQEATARHLPMGRSKRKAGSVPTWGHTYGPRADHPHYSGA